MFVTSINFRGTFESFWDLTEVSEQSWYKVLTYELVNPTFKLSLYCCDDFGTCPESTKSEWTDQRGRLGPRSRLIAEKRLSTSVAGTENGTIPKKNKKFYVRLGNFKEVS